MTERGLRDGASQASVNLRRRSRSSQKTDRGTRLPFRRADGPGPLSKSGAVSGGRQSHLLGGLADRSTSCYLLSFQSGPRRWGTKQPSQSIGRKEPDPSGVGSSSRVWNASLRPRSHRGARRSWSHLVHGLRSSWGCSPGGKVGEATLQSYRTLQPPTEADRLGDLARHGPVGVTITEWATSKFASLWPDRPEYQTPLLRPLPLVHAGRRNLLRPGPPMGPTSPGVHRHGLVGLAAPPARARFHQPL